MPWQLTVAGTPPIHDWDGEIVLYNRLSGDTHVLDIVTGEVLRRIASGTSRDDDLCKCVAGFLEVPNDAAVRDQVTRITQILDQIGLIEPVAEC
jgi:PqqD family protein of HPr-rel-A system